MSSLFALSAENNRDGDFGTHIAILSAYYELQIQKQKLWPVFNKFTKSTQLLKLIRSHQTPNTT